MIFSVDPINKTIEINETVNLKNLFDLLEKMFPKNGWHEYKLITKIMWQNPISDRLRTELLLNEKIIITEK